jgi:hypothetical protein
MKVISYCFSSFRYGVLSLLLTAAPAGAVEKLDKLEVAGGFGTKVYTNVVIVGTVPGGVKITHSDGIAVVPVNALPAALRDKLPPVPGAAAALTSSLSQREQVPTKTNPEPAPRTETPPSGESASAEVKANANGVVLIKGANGSGSGVLINVNGQQYLYTAVHVLAGITKPAFSTADGRAIKIGDQDKIEVSDEDKVDDVVRVRLESPLPTSLELSDDVEIGKNVAALGNSSGEGVVTAIAGKLLGVGPTEVEVDAKVVPGNSGGPVLLEGTTKVVGLVTRASAPRTDIWNQGTPSSEVRRFAVRPTKVTKWITMDFMGLKNQGQRLEALNMDTRSIAAVLCLTYNRTSIDAPSEKKGDYVIREVLREGSSTSVGATISAAIAKANGALAQGKATPLAGPYLKQLYGEFFNSVYSASRSGVASVPPESYVRFLRKRFAEESDLRKAIVTDLLKLSGEVQGAIR